MSSDPRKVRLSDLRRPDVTFVMGDAGAEVEFTVRGQLSIEEMMEAFEIQKGLDQEGDDIISTLQATLQARTFVEKLVLERNPEVQIPNMGMEEVMSAFVTLLGGVTASQKVAEAINAGIDSAVVEAQAAATQGGEEQVSEIEDELEENPTTPSPLPSSTPSPSSPIASAGVETNGDTSPGTASASLPSQPIGA